MIRAPVEVTTRSKEHENPSPKSNSNVVQPRERFEPVSRHRRFGPVLFIQCYGGKKSEHTIGRKIKLMDPEEGQGWSREYVNQMAIEYKRFLTLSVKYSEETIAPSKDVDKFWHGHILDTMKYAEDCQNVFGYFLHHFPYFGMRGEEDAANLAEAGRTTKRLYEQEFGEAVQAKAAY